MAKTKLVIEMGSNNTVIYKVGYGIVLREPTLVAVNVLDNLPFEAGNKAKKMLNKYDSTMKLVSPIVKGEVVDKDSATFMLKYFLDKVVKKTPFSKVDALFCVSIGLSDNQLVLFRDIAYSAGINNVHFENVCKTSLNGCGVLNEKSSAIACVNLGAETCNFGIISFGKTIEGFSTTFGGNDIDKAIIDYLKYTKNFEVSSIVAEKIKNECGSLYVQDMSNLEITGVDLDTKRPVSEIITSNEIFEVIYSFFEKIRMCIEKLLYSCSADIISDIAVNGIYITGGLANITGLENYLTKKLNIPVIISESPENCAVIGGSNF